MPDHTKEVLGWEAFGDENILVHKRRKNCHSHVKALQHMTQGTQLWEV